MSALLEITEKLQDTEAAIAHLEREIARQPTSPSVVASLASLRKRQRNLESQFADAAAQQHLDVCSYRLFPDEAEEERPTLRAFTKTLLDFQTLVTQVYYARKTGQPRGTTHVSADAATETAFGFAYTFTGSLGIVLTLPNERLLFGETEIDKAISTVFEMVKADSPQKIASYAKELGAAPIRTLYNWVSDQVRSGLSSQIEWRREREVRADLLVQFPELEELKRAIEATSDEETEELTLRGFLVGLDVVSRTFHMTFEEGEDIRGKISESVGLEHTVELPKLYTAKIVRTKKVYYSTERETVYHYLESLD
ncbi:MAG TPA: hypothetical protein VEY11_11360 [Pyrinomonadaceae bacterium]|nr:hypothetical protein [Pyrinomonadaceae bacterium]